MSDARPARLRVRAFAKINLMLRVLGLRADGYHDVRTTLQSVMLHDTLTLAAAPGAFAIECDDPACPADQSNLVWQAAERLWRADGRRGRPSGIRIAIRKRIPMRAGLGGGSSDAAAALRALSVFWRTRLDADGLHAIARTIGADVAYFLEGGTALGLDRGDVLFPLQDAPRRHVVIAVPDFGVSTADAYGWWDRPDTGRAAPGRRGTPANDLESGVAAHHPEIRRLVNRLRRLGAVRSGMSGSGSAVFGLFESRSGAETAAEALTGPRRTAIVTETVSRRRYQRQSAPSS